jgi:autotransporter-associated beta strand protein
MKGSSFCLGVIAALAAQSASAILPTCTWTGGGANGNWSTAANWNNCGGLHAVPIDGDTLVFPNAVPRTTNNNDIIKLIAAKLQINGVNYNITGNAIGLSGGISANVPLGVHGDTDPVFGPNIVLETNAQIFQCIGVRNVTLGGSVNLHDLALTVDGTCDIAIAGNVTGAGSIAKNGAGSLFLQGPASTYTGVTTINDGIVVAETDTALGAAGAGNETSVNDGGSLQLLSGIAIDEDLTLSGAGFGGSGALISTGADNTVNGDITLLALTTITTPPAANTLSLTGAMVGGFSVTKEGAGTLQLEGISDGEWFAHAGILEVNGSVDGAVAVSGAILAGSGLSTNTVSIESGGSLAPGPSHGTRPGTFSTHALNWKAGGVMAFGLGATALASDLVNEDLLMAKILSGSFTFDFADASTPPTPGVTYTLISFPSQNGFLVTDFDFVYTGTGPGTSMTGTFNLTATELQFTPITVVSDLVFRADNE